MRPPLPGKPGRSSPTRAVPAALIHRVPSRSPSRPRQAGRVDGRGAPTAAGGGAERLTGRRPWLAAAAGLFGVGWGANQFTSLLVAYHLDRGLSTSTDDALFGVYAVGLVPALLIGGPVSDRWGRSRPVRVAAVLSVGATAILMAGTSSTAALYAGRFLAGVVSGAAFAAGTAWVKELSVPPYDARAGESAGARRAAIALSAGFGLGPVVSAVVAQWSTDPLVFAYVPHLVVMALVLPGLWRVPETVVDPTPACRPAPAGRPPPAGRPTPASRPTPAGAGPPHREPLRPRPRPGAMWVSSARQPRFLLVVLPCAPWVFASASAAFAVLPTVIAAHTRGHSVVFAGATAGLTLAVGVGVQPLARRLDRVDSARGGLVGIGAVAAGLLVGAAAAHLGNQALVLVAAVVLGAGYGLTLVSGLLEVQRLAPAGELAGLTAVYYCATYVGFALPILLATASSVASYSALLVVTAAVALACGAVAGMASPRHPATGSRHPLRSAAPPSSPHEPEAPPPPPAPAVDGPGPPPR